MIYGLGMPFRVALCNGHVRSQTRRDRFVRWAAGAAISCGLLSPTRALAQGNDRSAPLGGRSVLMGTTGVALGRDGASPFMNPATLVNIEDEKFAFSVNLYQLKATSMRRFAQPGPVDGNQFGTLTRKSTSLTNVTLNALPSTLCIFLPIDQPKGRRKARAEEDRTGNRPPVQQEMQPQKRRRLGFCFGTVQRQEFSFTSNHLNRQNGGFSSQQASSVAHSWNRIAIGPSYAWDLSSSVTLGASLHGSITNVQSLWSADVIAAAPEGRGVSSVFTNSSYGNSIDVTALIGGTYHHGTTTFGVGLQLPSLHIFGKGGTDLHTQFTGTGTTDSSSSSYVDGSFVAPSAARLNTGIGFQFGHDVLEANVNVVLPQGASYVLDGKGTTSQLTSAGTTQTPLQARISDASRPTVNLGVGGEHLLKPNMSIFSGLSTDLSSVPASALASGRLFHIIPQRSHRLATSFGVGSYGRGGELLVGGELSYEWGRRLAVNTFELPPRFANIPYNSYSLMIIIAGSTNLRALRRAYEDIKDAVKPASEPVPLPAPNTL